MEKSENNDGKYLNRKLRDIVFILITVRNKGMQFHQATLKLVYLTLQQDGTSESLSTTAGRKTFLIRKSWWHNKILTLLSLLILL